MKFNENLKYLRKEAKMTQESLAERLNISRQAVTKWERGQSLPDIQNLKEISNIFGVTIDSLVGDVITKKESQINKKINDIGYFIFGTIILLLCIFFSVYEFIEKITTNENIKITTSIVFVLILFIVFILIIKLYLKDTENKIINMKPTLEGKKERKNMLIKKAGLEILTFFIYGIIIKIYVVPESLVKYVAEVVIWTLGGLIIITGIKLYEFLKLEKKVKLLNQEEK